MKGTVKWFNDRKGFGFIEGEDEKDIFVHRNSLTEGTYLNDGDEVEYEVGSSDKGPQAINVKKLENN
jgi:CspA family cold shock protein